MTQPQLSVLSEEKFTEIEILLAEESTDLETLKTIKPALIFSEGGSKRLLAKIESAVTTAVFDISTKTGREECAALSYKVARSKTFLDDVGKTLNADLKRAAKKIDDQRGIIWDTLEALQKKVRKPLTDWQEKEDQRTSAHKQALDMLESLAKFDTPPTTEILRTRMQDLESLSGRDWEEHHAMIQPSIDGARVDLQVRLDATIRADEEREELGRLRALQAERDAEDARKAEEAAEAERQRIHKEQIEAAAAAAAQTAIADAQAAQEKAESDRIAAAAETERKLKEAEDKRIADLAAAEKKSADDAAAAVAAEQKRIADIADAEEKARLQRESNRNHCAKINNEVVDTLVKMGFTQDQGKKIVEAIALGNVPHTQITY